MRERNCSQHQKSIKKIQTQLWHTVLREKGVEMGEKASKIKTSQIFRATPKPWVAGSNPPAPAKTKWTASKEVVHFVLLECILRWKNPRKAAKAAFTPERALNPHKRNAQMTAHAWVQNPPMLAIFFSVLSSVTVSVWYSIKKASRASKKYQKIVLWMQIWLPHCQFCILKDGQKSVVKSVFINSTNRSWIIHKSVL
jgi:hypothetical protein